MTTYHSNATLEVTNIAGLVWNNIDSATIAATDKLLNGDKVHDMSLTPTISCNLSAVAGADNADKVKMTFTIINAGFTNANVDKTKVWNSTTASGPWELGTEVTVDNTGLESQWDAIAHTMSRAYTFSSAASLTPYSGLNVAFTIDSKTGFNDNILNGMRGKLDDHIDNGSVEIFVKFETDSTDPHFEYYTDGGFGTTVSSGGSASQKFVLRMVQLHNDNHTLELGNKMSDVMNGTPVADFNVFSTHSMVFPVNVGVTEGFNNSPGKFGIRITFA